MSYTARWIRPNQVLINNYTMITEQTEITVKFKIHELLHIHDQLLIAHDETYDDNKTICCYLMDRINEQLPDFTESENFYKPIVPANYEN